jgi:lysozyme
MTSLLARPARRFFVLALLSLSVVGGAAFTPTSAQAAPKGRVKNVEGIDISHWNGAIDWARVARAGKKFAFMKATEDTTFVDPKFASYRAGANAVGIAIGAYHYGQPSTAAGDAVAEAASFVSTVGTIATGDLKPELDLEVTNGMSASQLTQWTLEWLNEVYRLTGTRPMVFTTNGFWTNKMGNTQAIAQAGYRLWISYGGGGQSPTVPASNWGGTGWSFWKYDNCGTVSGISGCVDVDKANGTSLTAFLSGS